MTVRNDVTGTITGSLSEISWLVSKDRLCSSWGFLDIVCVNE